MADVETRVICHNCAGTGYRPHGEPPHTEVCADCEGTGYLHGGILKLPSGVFHTYEVLEATDLTEYNALADANKTLYAAIVSLGQVNLSEGTQVRGWLWAMFTEGTDTRTNLETLVG